MKRKSICSFIAFLLFAAIVGTLMLVMTISVTAADDVQWKAVFAEDFEGSWGTKIDEVGGSGTKTPTSAGDCNKSDGTAANLSTYSNTGSYLGSKFKRIAQGSTVGPNWIQTKTSLVNGYDTSVVKISCDIARSTNGYTTVTVIAVQGDLASGTTNSETAIEHINNEQWLFSLEDSIY
ncbi:MAG: hypothetical protein IKR46_02570, partial [Clostridia bacterium]|nr:hypothetical protein [Clostridia bacterium]